MTTDQVRGVILDVDGTLVDSNAAHAQSWVDTLAEYGYRVPFAKVYKLIGMGGDKLLPAVCGVEKETAEGQRISERRAELFAERFLPGVRAFPGTHALLQRMRDSGLQLAVASSAQAKELSALLKIAGAADLVEERTSSSDAEHSKPDPDIVQTALDRLGAPPEQVVMLGDTPYDIEAARKAGVAIIALRCGGWDDQGLAGAITIYDDPADLLAHYDESPLAARLAAGR